MKTAVKQALLSTSPINPSPNSLFLPVSTWAVSGSTLSADGIISETAENSIHAIVYQSPSFTLQDNVPYRWTVWVRPLNRRFCYLTVAPSRAGTRFVTVWGLDGQGILDTKQIGTSISNTSFGYKKIQQGILRLTFDFTINTGANSTIPVIGAVDTFPCTYTGFFDITYVGLMQSSIQILGSEVLPI